MSILEQYRSSTEYREILRILQKASLNQENFLWQSHVLGKTIIPIQHFEIDFVAREVVLTFDDQLYKLDLELPLYVKLEYHETVFKAVAYRHSTRTIHFSFPHVIKTAELRSMPRHQFHPGQEKIVGIKSSTGGFHKELGNVLSVRCIDISKHGLGLLVSEFNRPFLKNNRVLWVTQLQDSILPYPILAEVVYLNGEVEAKFVRKKQRDLKVGLRLSGEFPPEIYHEFIK